MINPLASSIPGSVPAAQPDVGAGSSGGRAGSGPSSFLDTLRGAVDQVSQIQSEADAQVTSMLGGNGQDVHSAMIAVEKANLTFELMLQVRNKIVSAYQEVSKIPF
jgi:flagellar hook-basal body complex protein FliE